MLAAVSGTIVAALIWTQYEQRAEEYDLSKIGEVSQRSAVFDKDGRFYSHFEGANRIVVPLKDVSPLFVSALIAREDQKFWHHKGLDFEAIVRAALKNARCGRVEQGASTLTQQLARNRFGLTERSYRRKLLEAFLARRIERAYSKDEILELYVNQIYFGEGLYGIEAASRGYFGKHANELTLGECATLAGLVRSPNRYSPRENPEIARLARDNVLSAMVRQGRITAPEAAPVYAEQLPLNRRPVFEFEENYAVDAVRREIETILPAYTISMGGLRIHTAIDPDLQRTAEQIANNNLKRVENRRGFPHPSKAEFKAPEDPNENKPTDYLQTAIVAVENSSGGIRAIVGGRDYTQSKFLRAWIGRRQVGSTFKPFVYAAAFEKGLLPGSFVDDSEITPVDLKGYAPNWSPRNSDGDNLGIQRAAIGLIKSRNTMTVRVGLYAGLERIQQLAKQLGIGDSMKLYPSALLGAFEVTPKDLTAAYSVFPNQGIHRPAHIITRIEDHNGAVIYRFEPRDRQFIEPGAAWLVNSLLQQVMKVGTAAQSESLGWKLPAGGKTGTTDKFHDAWFVGYTSSLTCGVWVGMDKPETIIRRGYGATLALPTWIEVMQQAHKLGYSAGPLRPTEELVPAVLCSETGKLATANCTYQGLAYSMSLPVSLVPKETCKNHPDFSEIAEFENRPPPIASGPSPSGLPSPAPQRDAITSVTAVPSPAPQIAVQPLPQNTPPPSIPQAGGDPRLRRYDDAMTRQWQENPPPARPTPTRPRTAVPPARIQLIITPDGRVVRVRPMEPAEQIPEEEELRLRNQPLLRSPSD